MSVISAGAAQASSLSISAGGSPSTLTSNFDPSYLPAHNPDNIHGTGGSPTPITVFGNGSVGGLKVNGADANTFVTYTYLGTEAAYTNLFMVGASPVTLFQNHNVERVAGVASSLFSASNGFLSFRFRSVDPGNKDAVNGVSIDPQVQLAVALINPNLAYLFLEDIAQGGDHDFDDMVIRVDLIQRGGGNTPTPVPGAAWLFGSAIAGAPGLRGWRRRGTLAKGA
ncbi:MAG: hypothetical protein ACXWJ6_14395 [Xanthobacteraceae bacterium]